MPWRVHLHLRQENARAPGEPGDVPVITTRFEEPRRRLQVRLLKELLDATSPSRSGPRCVQIAKPRRRVSRLEPDRDYTVRDVRSSESCAQLARSFNSSSYAVLRL